MRTDAVEDALPGSELVRQGLGDLAEGRLSAEGLLLERFRNRLGRCGVTLPGEPVEDPERRLYELLSSSSGNAAHGAYNALTRRLVSYMRAAERARAS